MAAFFNSVFKSISPDEREEQNAVGVRVAAHKAHDSRVNESDVAQNRLDTTRLDNTTEPQVGDEGLAKAYQQFAQDRSSLDLLQALQLKNGDIAPSDLGTFNAANIARNIEPEESQNIGGRFA